MKKIGVGTLILIIAVSIYSQEAFTKYIPIQNFSGLPVIQVSNLDDLVQLARQARVSTAFVLKRGSGDSSTLLVQIDSTYYSFEMNGFTTVGDFRRGSAHGFQSGASFLEASSLGIADFDLYAYYKRNSFSSVDDAKKAFGEGFVSEKGINCLPILPLRFGEGDLKDLSARVPLIARLLAPPNPRMGITNQPAYEIVEKNYVLIDPTKRNGNSGGTFYDPNTRLPEYQIYYLALANGLNSYKAYAELSEAVANGYGSISDYKNGKLNAFSGGQEYYMAKTNGFVNAVDYRTALQLRLKTFQEYQPVKDFADSISAEMDKQSISFAAAAYTVALGSFPRGKAYSLQSAVDLMNATISSSPALRSYLALNRFSYSVEGLRSFLQKSANVGLGKYDAEGDVFVRN